MKINNSYILLKDICCFAYHGVAPQENIIGNEYIINLKLKVDTVRLSNRRRGGYGQLCRNTRSRES